MIIESYSFGKIKVNDKVYTSDLIIFPESIDPSWWRKEGHYLQVADITEIVEKKPEVLIIGTGFYGYMKISPEVIEHLNSSGLKYYIEKTKIAVDIYNNTEIYNKTGAFHLTC